MEFLFLIILVVVIVFAIKSENKRHIKNSAQYQVYLGIAETLKESGYEVIEISRKQNRAQSSVKKAGEHCANLVVVNPPKNLWYLGNGPARQMIDSYSAYATEREVMEIGKKRGYRYCCPNNSLISADSHESNQEGLKCLNIISQVLKNN